jgi:hypothetical protein
MKETWLRNRLESRRPSQRPGDISQGTEPMDSLLVGEPRNAASMAIALMALRVMRPEQNPAQLR